MSRIWGRSVKYALWTLSREVCVIIDYNLYVKSTLRLVFTDVGKLTLADLVSVDRDMNITLTNKGQSMVPTELSPTANAQAMRFFVPGVAYVLDDQHCVRADGGVGKASRYVTEVLLSKGVLEQVSYDQPIRLADHGPTLTLKFALWTLSNEDCYVANDVLRARSDDRVVYRDAHWLEVNSYIDRHAKITDYGRRQIPKRLGDATVARTLEVFSEYDRWQFQGNFAVGENGGRLSRYVVERLIQIGKLQINTGGYITKPEDRVWYKCHLTASQYARYKGVLNLVAIK